MTNKCAYFQIVNIYSDVPLDFTCYFPLVSKVGSIEEFPHGLEQEVLIVLSKVSGKFINLYIIFRLWNIHIERRITELKFLSNNQVWVRF